MPEYVLNRNYVLRTTTGHSVRFEKNKPTFVPKLIERDAQLIGAERVDGVAPDILDPEKPVEVPLSPDEREVKLREAFALLIDRNESNDFTGSGVPSVPSVEKLVGFDTDRKEVGSVWSAYRAEQA